MISLKPLWISHRGLHDLAPENSLAAFHAAVKAGFDGLETDLRTTLDGRIFLCHDVSLLRVAGTDRRIGASSSEDLSNMRLADGHPIPTLDTFIDSFPNVSWTFDVKPEEAPATIRALERMLENPTIRAKFQKQARFLFWKKAHEDAFHAVFPEAVWFARERQCYQAGIAVLARLPFLGGIKQDRIYALTPHFSGVNLYQPAFVTAYRDRGARVVAYLPRNPEEFRLAVAAGVDEILSDGYIDHTLSRAACEVHHG